MFKDYDENLLLGFVEGELNAAEHAKVAAWAQRDPRLAQLLTKMQEDRHVLMHSPDPHAPSWIMDEVDRQIERGMLIDEPVEAGGASPSRWMRIGPATISVAIAAVVAIVGGVVIWSLMSVSAPTPAGPSRVAQRPTAPSEEPESPLNPPPTPVVEAPTPAPTPVSQRTPVPTTAARQADAQTVTSAWQPRPEFSLPWSVDLESALQPAPPKAQSAPSVAAANPTRDGHEPSAPTTIRPFARPAGSLPTEKLTVPKQLLAGEGVEVKGPDGVKALVELLETRPELAEECRLEIVSRDPVRTKLSLIDLSAPPSQAPPGSLLYVKPAGLPDALESLRAQKFHVSVRLFHPALSPKPPGSGEPDYVRILTDQLPAAPKAKKDSTPVAIPVVIQQPKE